MILRKPYAFFIKHFKLIHIILAVLVCYSIYHTKLLLDFFYDYSNNVIDVQGQNLVSPLLPFLYQIIPLLIIIISTVVLVIMITKKKPYTFYIINIGVFVFTLIIIQASKTLLLDLSKTIIEIQKIMLIRDLVMVSFLGQLVSIIIISIRATGFDVRKFDFQTDLKYLEISEEDREEVEVEIKFDTNRSVRNLRKKIRFLKYTYKENRMIFNCTFILATFCLGVFLMVSFFNKNRIITQNTYFSGNNFSMNLLDSYLVNTDYKGKKLNDDYYLILKIKIKSTTNKENVLDIATTKLLIDNFVYTPVSENRDSFFDFGTSYQGEAIGNDYEVKTLIYQIPKQLIKKDIYFSFVDKNTMNDNGLLKSTKVKIDYTDLTGISSLEKSTINNELSFKDSILSDYTITINAYDIKKQYKLQYNFCVADECFKSYEYLKTEINGNYDKSLLKIKGTLNKETNISKIHDLYDFIENFGLLSYVINGEKKYQNINFKEVVSKKIKEEDTYYIEVLREVEKASNISFIFTIRNKKYEYILK